MTNKVLQTVELKKVLSFNTEEEFDTSLKEQDDLNSEVSKYFNDPNIKVISMELDIKLIIEEEENNSFFKVLDHTLNNYE